jgi:hypothetical protein
MIQNPVPVLGQHGLRVELNPVHRMLDVLNRHDLAVLRGGGYPER